MEIKSGYVMNQIKIFYEIFMEIKSRFQRKIFSNQGKPSTNMNWRSPCKSRKLFKEILKHKNKKETGRRLKVSIQTITELKFKIKGSRSFHGD